MTRDDAIKLAKQRLQDDLQLMLSLKRVIAIADKAYPDHIVDAAFRARGNPVAQCSAGDGLGTFIANELAETFDPARPEDVLGPLDTAIEELTTVRDALAQAFAKEHEKAMTAVREEAFALVRSSHGTIYLDKHGNVIWYDPDSERENPLCWKAQVSGVLVDLVIFAFDLTHPGDKAVDGPHEYDILELPAYCVDGHIDPAVWPMGINPDNDEQDKTIRQWQEGEDPRTESMVEDQFDIEHWRLAVAEERTNMGYNEWYLACTRETPAMQLTKRWRLAVAEGRTSLGCAEWCAL